MSNQFLILRKHKNNLLEILRESGFDPNLFITHESVIKREQYFIITLRDSPIIFAVRADSSSFDNFFFFHSSFRVNFPSTDTYFVDWKELVTNFKYWLNYVVKPYIDEINTPDLWHILEETRSRTKGELATPMDFESFSAEEKVQIRLSLKDFQLLVAKNFNPNKEELESIDTRLKYLSDALDKHNKFDWKGIAIHTVIAITVALSLGPEQGQLLWELFKEVFSNVLYLLP